MTDKDIIQVSEEKNLIRGNSKLRVNDQLALLVDIAPDSMRFASAKMPVNPEIVLRLEIQLDGHYLFDLKGTIQHTYPIPQSKIMKEAEVTLDNPPQEFVQFLEKYNIHEEVI